MGARGAKQKQKLLYLAKIMLEKTDDNHGLTVNEIIDLLEQYDITAERKSIYSDLEELTDFGIEILTEKVGRSYTYHVGSRQFELAELKMLVDTVQASKYITEKKSRQLIKKLEGLVSVYEAKMLQREVQMQDRIKTMNETVLYSVDTIQQAMAENKQITFKYYQWNEKKEMVLRHDGAIYRVSPWNLVLDQENYYLIGFDQNAKAIKHYRVDKMIRLKIADKKREGRERYETRNMATYTTVRFGMFDGVEEMVSMEFENRFAGVVIDRFGKDVRMLPIDENHFRVKLKIVVSSQFFGWVLGLGDGVKITGPEYVVQQMKEQVKKIWMKYEGN